MWGPKQNSVPIGSAVLTFIGYKQTDKQTDRQAKFMYRFIFYMQIVISDYIIYIYKIVISVFLSVCLSVHNSGTSWTEFDFDWGDRESHGNVLCFVLGF